MSHEEKLPSPREEAGDEASALMYAAEQGAIRSMQAWQRRGGDLRSLVYYPSALSSAPSASPPLSFSVLQYAAFLGHATAVRTLLECGAPSAGSLSVACEHGHSAVLDALLDWGVDVTTTDSYGQTPLHFAAAFGRTPCIRQLIRAGADTNARDASGKTAYDLAVAGGHTDTAHALLASGERPSDPTPVRLHSSMSREEPFPPAQPAISSSRVSYKPEASFEQKPSLPQTLRPGVHFAPPSFWQAPSMPSAMISGDGRGSLRMAGPDGQSRLFSWLSSISLPHLFPAFLLAGFDDVDFIHSIKLRDEDVDCIVSFAVPEASPGSFTIPPGSRRKLLSLYNIEAFISKPPKAAAASPASPAASSEEDNEEESGEESGEEESGEDSGEEGSEDDTDTDDSDEDDDSD
jgi:hypothetical protein